MREVLLGEKYAVFPGWDSSCVRELPENAIEALNVAAAVGLHSCLTLPGDVMVAGLAKATMKAVPEMFDVGRSLILYAIDDDMGG